MRKLDVSPYALAFIALLTLAACRPISRGPTPPYRAFSQPESPIARGPVSPLYSRGEAPAIDGYRALIASPEEARSGTIPVDTSKMRYVLYAPIMAHQKDYPCYMAPFAAGVFDLMIHDKQQNRRNPDCSDTLTRVAQGRAEDMVKRKYFDHFTPEGYGPNHWIYLVGCLPDYYPPNGNTTESIGLNWPSPDAAWNAFMRSRPHEFHLRGLHPEFAKQVRLGIGYATSAERKVLVILTTIVCP